MDIAWLHIAAHDYGAMAWNHCIWIHWYLNDFFAIALDGCTTIQLHHGIPENDYMTITCNAAINVWKKDGGWPHKHSNLSIMARTRLEIIAITCNTNTGAWKKKWWAGTRSEYFEKHGTKQNRDPSVSAHKVVWSPYPRIPLYLPRFCPFPTLMSALERQKVNVWPNITKMNQNADKVSRRQRHEM